MDANTRCAMYHSGLQLAASVEIAKRLSPVDTAAAYTIWNRWIASRGFNPPPGPRSWTVKPLSATAGSQGKPQQSNGKASNVGNGNGELAGQATAGQATAGTATENREGISATEKGKSDCPCPCESQRI